MSVKSSAKTNAMVGEINRVPVPEGIVKVYTDASFKNGVASYAFMVCDGPSIYLESDSVPEEWLSEFSRSAELYGVKRALEYVAKKGVTQVGLFFDYVGIYNCQITRPTDPEIYRKYARFMQRISQKIEIFFHKTDGVDDLHELVDLVSRASVRLRLGGNEIGQYRKLISERKTTKSR